MADISTDSERYKAGEVLLEAANAYWKACHKEGQYGAVQWLQGADGNIVIFTRGEYRKEIMANIERLNGMQEVNFFNVGDEEE
ncbi:MAG: hypothetical protein WC091_02535 [Sulfuricellaceae bacterium]